MSHDSYVCGFIKLTDCDKATRAISSLPAISSHDTGPYLTSSMFSLTTSPEYRDKIIHFAASYKDILGSWDEWISKFSGLLQRFEFDEVKMIIEDCYAGDQVVRWNCGSAGHPISKAQIAHRLNYENDPDFGLFKGR